MNEITTVGLDLAKHVFQVHGVDAAGATVLRKQLRRAQVLAFFSRLPRCLVGMEACATAHYWARELSALGHEVRLMPAQYVKAYIKRNKNDAADAEAICEAVARPTMRFVPGKTAEQQAAVLLHRGRERLVRQRTMLVNAVRGHLAEFGVIAPQGLRNVGELIAVIRDEEDARLPGLARQVLQVLATQIEQIEAAVTVLEKQLMAWHKSNPVSQRLATIPGIGPIIATAVAAMVAEPSGFSQRSRICSVARSGAAAEFHRRQKPIRRHIQARQPVFATAADQRCQRQSATLEGDQCRSMGDRAAPAPAKPCRGGGISEQDGAHRLGGDAPAGELPAHGHGGLGCQASSGACERAMTRDGTVGRSDATERSLALRWDVDPVRVMRPRFADSIRASSRFGLHQQAGHMTASDLCAARQIISCQAGAIHT